MPKTKSNARAQRRAYENWLKKTNPQQYAEWKSDSLERGKNIHESHVSSINDKQEEHYQNLQANMIVKLREQGLSDEEIDKQVAIWVMTIKPWGTEGKPLSLKEAIKEYEAENAPKEVKKSKKSLSVVK